MQTVRLRKAASSDAKNTKSAPPARHTGILQDKLRRSARRIWSPSWSLAFRMLLLARISAAMYSNIDDCDEVFNFWEPLHFLDRGRAFQTWEHSPVYALRSWTYILLHLAPARLAGLAFPGGDKRPAFFFVRMCLATLSTVCEATFYRTVSANINEHVGRYLFVMLLFSTGMWNASAAFLPSSFAMYACTMAASYWFIPSSTQNSRRVVMSTVCFAVAGILGWPFAVALAIPFVFEELFIPSADSVLSNKLQWMKSRWQRLLAAGLVASVVFVPVVIIDSLAYGHLTLTPWNIVHYNIFGGSDRGPDLYGTEPWYYYVLNLILNFNALALLALFSFPALAVTYAIDRKRLGFHNPSSGQSSPYTVLALRLAPFYLWFIILSMQPHKEERFMFPAYPLLCFNAAVSLYLVRGWQEVIFIKITQSPYQASQSSLFRSFTLSMLVMTSFVSVSRILALGQYYHTPMSVFFRFQTEEVPRLLNDTGLIPLIPKEVASKEEFRIDLTPLRQLDLLLCVAKEWHRFPGHYLVPDGVSVGFVQSEFRGLLPGQFWGSPSVEPSDIWPWAATRHVPSNQNDLNREEPSHYVPLEQCDYLVDLDFPLHPPSPREPKYGVNDSTWERVFCLPFLDAQNSRGVARMLWVPSNKWHSLNAYGDYCLLRHRERVAQKEADVRKQHSNS